MSPTSPTMNVGIRAEQRGDFARIAQAIAAAFGQGNEARLVEVLRAKPEFIPELSLVAVFDERIVGHILFFPVEIAGKKVARTLCLAPMAVTPDHQRKGIGAKLVEAGLRTAAKLGWGSVIVVGHPDYYPRFGFLRASGWGMRLPFDAPDEAFMALELMPGGLAEARGIVRFPEEYSACT